MLTSSEWGQSNGSNVVIKKSSVSRFMCGRLCASMCDCACDQLCVVAIYNSVYITTVSITLWCHTRKNSPQFSGDSEFVCQQGTMLRNIVCLKNVIHKWRGVISLTKTRGLETMKEYIISLSLQRLFWEE